MATTYLKSNFIDRQEKERKITEYICGNMPVGIEQRFLSAGKVANESGFNFSSIDALLRKLENLGVISRRMEFGAKDDRGKVITGRSFHWTLLVNKDEALRRLTEYHERERLEYNRPPSPKGTSLKSRIMTALGEYRKFETIDDLAKAVRRPKENLDYHNLTHVMESLNKQGKITFERGRTKDRIPYNIVLTKNGARALEPIKPENIVLEDVPPVFDDSIEPIDVMVRRVVTDFDEFPIAMRLMRRREHLEQAARLAEYADEDDVAILLLERIKKPLTALEEEHIKLFEAYKACREEK